MDDPNTTEDFSKFYKINGNGRWQKKSPRGSYEEMKDTDVFKRLQILTAKSIKRIE